MKKLRASSFDPGERSTMNFTTAEEQSDVQVAVIIAAIGVSILELPGNIIYNILSRLPLKTILLCKCVCKKFLEVLRDPYFAKVHLANGSSSTASLIFLQRWNNLGFPYMYTFDLSEPSKLSSMKVLPYDCPCGPHPTIIDRMRESLFISYKIALVGSCNGLVCFYSALGKPFYFVCNPILGEFVILPHATGSPWPPTQSNHSAFGFCPKTGEYKILRFISLDPVVTWATQQQVFEIHTLGANSWRRLDGGSCIDLHGSFVPYHDGTLNWITGSRETSEIICSFDLEKECFRPVLPPSHFTREYISKVSRVTIGILGGYLCLCYIYEDAQFEIWEMRKNSTKASWMKFCSIDVSLYPNIQPQHFQLSIKYHNNGDLWLLCKSDSVLVNIPKIGSFKVCKNLNIRPADVIAHVPSFVSLKHVNAGGNLKVEYRKWRKSNELMNC